MNKKSSVLFCNIHNNSHNIFHILIYILIIIIIIIRIIIKTLNVKNKRMRAKMVLEKRLNRSSYSMTHYIKYCNGAMKDRVLLHVNPDIISACFYSSVFNIYISIIIMNTAKRYWIFCSFQSALLPHERWHKCSGTSCIFH